MTGNNTQAEAPVKVYTVSEMQKMLRIGRDKAYALFHSKGFPSMRIGRQYIVTEKAFNEWLNRYENKEYIL